MSERVAVTILRLPSVISRTGLSRSSIYAMIRLGKFPPSVSLGGPRAVGWVQRDIDDWLERLTVRDNNAYAQKSPHLRELQGGRKNSIPTKPTTKFESVTAAPSAEIDKSDVAGCVSDSDNGPSVTPETPTVPSGDLERSDVGAGRPNLFPRHGGEQVLSRPSHPPRIQWPRRNG